MYTRVFEQRVTSSPEKVWEFFSNPRGLDAITDSRFRTRFLGSETCLEDGKTYRYRIWQFGILPMIWVAAVDQVTSPYGFTDQAQRSPFSFWRHRHDFIPDGEGTLIRDMLVYEMPFGRLGKLINKLVVQKQIERLFENRKRALHSALG